ncbi:DUF2855 family protein [Parvibaculum sp.]|jgi:hypothetical protein|uniref:DUF2855 family protein n=2 Tax=Parvibaculum sp. TaxID=2024848 RepID=UPI002FD940DB
MSTQIREFIVNRANYADSKWIAREAEVENGQVLAEIEKFAFTANNITYAVAGDMLNYWAFFPADEGWGKIPVWGFAKIVKSKCPDIKEGERIYGYLPMATSFVMQPEKVTGGSFLDLYKQRRELHPVYNSYSRVSAERPHDDLEPILRPLYTTSFLIDDWLADNDFFGAKQAVLISASSKTGLGLAYGLHQRRPEGPEVIGLTSAGNKKFVEGLGYYDKTVVYGDVAALDASLPTLAVDFAGDGDVIAAVHRHFGDKLVESTTVGLSHKDAPRPPSNLPGAKPSFFFAPDQMKKRSDEWGRDGFDKKLGESWNEFAKASARWIKVEHGKGEDAIARVYSDMLAGKINPAEGHILSLK